MPLKTLPEVNSSDPPTNPCYLQPPIKPQLDRGTVVWLLSAFAQFLFALELGVFCDGTLFKIGLRESKWTRPVLGSESIWTHTGL